MKRPSTLLVVTALNLVALLAIVFAYPNLMVSPGPLMAGHEQIATDCFACHAPWRGAATTRCITCHVPRDIGLRTTRGVPLASKRVAFHQHLVQQDCLACHTDHLGAAEKRARKPFSHGLLQADIRSRCEQCHAPPDDRLHESLRSDCGRCHDTRAWSPAHFEHDRYFVLDRDHDAACRTCHEGGNLRRYTCYGCHEHTPAGIREEHLEEGIRNFEDCVECHRDPRVEPEEHGGRGGRGGDD